MLSTWVKAARSRAGFAKEEDDFERQLRQQVTSAEF